MAEAYSGCTSYRDSGVSMLKITDGPIVRKPFKTVFVRPARFRFECSQWAALSKLVFVVWTNGTVFKSYSPAEGWKSHDNLHLPLAAATGVSGGTAAIVPELLLPADVSGFPLTEMMTDVERLADADVGTARCYCLRGRLADFTITMWIDQQTHLLLRMERIMQSDGDEATEITTYEPEIDIQIADADLELEPPSE